MTIGGKTIGIICQYFFLNLLTFLPYVHIIISES